MSDPNSQMPPCVLAPAVAADIPRLVELLATLFAIEQDFRADAEKQARGLALLIAQPARGVVMTARDAQQGIVGMVSAQLVVSTAEGTYSAWIEDMVVDQSCRARGIGKALLTEVLAWAQAQGATRAQLLVDLDNAPALGYYQHLGWQTTRLGARRLGLKC